MLKGSQIWPEGVSSAWLLSPSVPIILGRLLNFLAHQNVPGSFCTLPAPAGISQLSKEPPLLLMEDDI